MLSLKDGERMSGNNSSGLMKSPRLSETTTGRTTASKSKVMETATISKQPLASILDGGNCSDTKIV